MSGFPPIRAATGVILFLFLIVATPLSADHGNLQSDKELLLDLKEFLLVNNTVNRGRYAVWRTGDASPCSWPGITCESGRVTAIDLSSSTISAEIYPRFSSLTALTSLDLSDNAFSGRIPWDLGRCTGLRHLNLSYNILKGELNVSGLVNLETIDLTKNRLTGGIKNSFPSDCSRLITVNLALNRFSGDVLGVFDGCSNLNLLDLSANLFTGEIWKGFATLKEFSISENNVSGSLSSDIFSRRCDLEILDLSGNSIEGIIPAEIARCGGLVVLNLWGNKISGKIPSKIGSLKNMKALVLGNNSFDQEVPGSIANCTKLTLLDLSQNGFTGDIQKTFGEFRQIRSLTLHGNFYTGGIVSSGILKIPNITRIDLSFNKFSGDLPIEFARVSTLKYLILANNSFSGSIPPEIGNLPGLQALDISYNELTGRIPREIGRLTSLLWLMLAENSLTGEIPPEIGNCSSLLWMNLADNMLSGQLPSEISKIGIDPERTFADNRANLVTPIDSGDCLAIKRWIPAMYPPFSFAYSLLDRQSCRGMWESLLKGQPIFKICERSGRNITKKLDMSGYIQLTGNYLSGQIPASLGDMKKLSLLNLGYNHFTGILPPEMGGIPLEVLNVSSNNISGPIPDELGELICLESLDLSLNNFSGSFPAGPLSQLTELTFLNVSYNQYLNGTVTTARQLGTFTEDSFLGDPFLCVQSSRNYSGGCSPTVRTIIRRHPVHRRPLHFHKGAIVGLIFPLISLGIILCGVLVLIFCHVAGPPLPNDQTVSKSVVPDFPGDSSPEYDNQKMTMIFQLDKTAFTYADIANATENFSPFQIIGRGGFGTVYRGKLSDGREVAVKKLQREGSKAEKEFRAEMEVLSGGKLGWRHPNLVPLYGWCLFGSEKLLVYEFIPGGNLEEAFAEGRLGGWRWRMKVAEGVARALVYLHHECCPSVVHRDVKASNVLLDAGGRARVTDFGLARVVEPDDTHVSTAIAGTPGYVAPEYGQAWRATTRGDVYSYGVVLMELVTGQRAVGERREGDDGACLVDWVRGWSPGGLGFVVDPALRREGGLDRMVRMLQLALRCTEETPRRRPNMREVLVTLVEEQRKCGWSPS